MKWLMYTKTLKEHHQDGKLWIQYVNGKNLKYDIGCRWYGNPKQPKRNKMDKLKKLKGYWGHKGIWLKVLE